MTDGARSAHVSVLVTFVAPQGFGFSGGVRGGSVAAAGWCSWRVDNVRKSGGRGVCGAVGIPHFLANEVGQSPIEAVLLHPFKEGVRHLSFFVR